MGERITDWITSHGDKVEVFPRRSLRGKRWHWRVRAAGNWEIVEHGESYVNRSDAITGALRHHPHVADGVASGA